MEVCYYICFFVMGAVLASFYGVIGLRLPIGKSFIKGRSYCDSCHHPLAAIDLIPIISYLLTSGRCRYCNKKISLMLPFIELATGILFMVAYHSFGISLDLLLSLAIISLLIIVLVSDLTYLIIPDEVLIFFSILFIIIQLFRVGLFGTLFHIGTGCFLFFLMYFIMIIGNYFFKKESMGGADIKLMFLFGLVLDPLLGTMSIFLGSFIALPISLLLYYIKRDKVIPFGPFLTIALLLIFFTKLTPTDILSFLGL